MRGFRDDAYRWKTGLFQRLESIPAGPRRHSRLKSRANADVTCDELVVWDGGGRLSRSVRPLRPQADLKMAALGAGILLREQLSLLARFWARFRAAKPAVREQSSNRFIATLERYAPRRVGIAATVLMLTGSLALGVVKGNHVDEMVEAFSDARNAAANAAGFRIASVILNGRKQLTQDEILAIGGVNGRSSL